MTHVITMMIRVKENSVLEITAKKNKNRVEHHKCQDCKTYETSFYMWKNVTLL